MSQKNDLAIKMQTTESTQNQLRQEISEFDGSNEQEKEKNKANFEDKVRALDTEIKGVMEQIETKKKEVV